VGVEDERLVDAEREWIEGVREGVPASPETFRAAESGGAPIEPSIRFTAFVTADIVGPLTRTLFASVFMVLKVSAVFSFPTFPTLSFELSDRAEGGRITVGVLKMDDSRLWEAGAGVLPAVPRTPILRFS